MISTHNTSLTTRISDNLNDRGIDIASADSAKPLTIKNFSASFLNNLFSFPYLDFAFVRYESEMLTINKDGVLNVFGVCDAGIFAISSSKSIVLIDDENRIEEVASTTTQFIKIFHLIVHASTAPELSQDLTKELLDREAKANIRLWKEAFYALTDGFAGPNRHVLAAFKDGVIRGAI